MALNEEIRQRLGQESVNALSLSAWCPNDVYQNVLCALFKSMYPHNYCFFGFDYYYDGLGTTADDRLSQVKNFMDIGFDGLKIIEGKPSIRKQVGRSFLVDEFKKAFAYLEEHNIPIKWHVADPEENWDKSKCDQGTIEAGWCYDAPGFLSKEEHIAEALTMLDRHPGLNVTFAHFLFSAFDIDYAAHILEKYPTVKYDLAPGAEMFVGFDQKPKEWRDFFIKYQDRIIFGTDNGWGDTESPKTKIKNGLSLIAFITDFLSTSKQVQTYNKIPVRGLSLPPPVVQKILSQNFKSTLQTKTPKPLNKALLKSYASTLLQKINTPNKYPQNVKKRANDAFLKIKD